MHSIGRVHYVVDLCESTCVLSRVLWYITKSISLLIFVVVVCLLALKKNRKNRCQLHIPPLLCHFHIAKAEFPFPRIGVKRYLINFVSP